MTALSGAGSPGGGHDGIAHDPNLGLSKLLICQFNASKSLLALDELLSSFNTNGRLCHVLLLQEIPRRLPSRYEGYSVLSSDDDPRAGVLVHDSIPYTVQLVARNIVSISLNCGTSLTSVYLAPDGDINVDISLLETAPLGIICCDTNASSLLWCKRLGHHRSRSRGQRIEEFLSLSDHLVVNDPDCPPTFVSRSTGSASHIDVTLASLNCSDMVSNWVVEDNVDTASDHAPITFDLLVTENPATVVIKKIKNYRKSDLVTFDAAVGDGLLSLGTPKRIASAAELESVTRELSDLIAGAVETSSPLVRAVGPKRKRWWSGNLERLKVDFYSARRLFRKGRLTIEELHRKKNDYYHAIRDAKRDCFKADLARIGKDGRGLKKLLSKKEKSPDPLQVGSIDALADHFLGSTRPCCGPTWYSNQDCTNRDDSLKNFLDGINDKAVVNAIKGFDDFKSAGPDNVMYYHWKRAILHHGLAEHIAEICKGCLRTSTFPSILKVSHTILIPKKGRAGMRGFRPITLSNTLSKIVEKVLLNSFSRVSHPGCEWQHAYSSGRNTSTFVNEVIDAYGRGNASRSCSLIVSADIKGAFDACSWRLIHKEACRVFPQPIVNFVDDYLSGRVANLVTSGPSASRELTAGFPQGSVLGPYLWKLATAGILEELNDVYGYFCKAYAYADDFVVVVRGMDSKDLVDKALVSLDILESWAKSYGMDIVPTKVEFLVRNGLLDAIDYERLNRAGSASDCIRMVGILLDANLSFGRHISHQCAKAKVMVLRVKTFARLSYGLGDDAVRAAWEQFGLSIATYGSEVWGHKALNSGTYAILS